MKITSKIILSFFSFILLSISLAHAELPVGKTCKVLNHSELREAPSNSAKKLVNKKMLRWDPDTVYYYSIDKSTTVRIEEIKGDWVRVQLVSPPELRSTHKGWVLSEFIEGGSLPSKKNTPAKPQALKLFPSPEKCIKIPATLGLSPAEGLPRGWTSCAGVWGNYTTATTSRGGFVNNEVTCDIESKSRDYVERITVRANCYNSSGEQATLSKFESVVRGLLNVLEKSSDLSELATIPPSKNLKIEKESYSAEFKKEKFNTGYGWVFEISRK